MAEYRYEVSEKHNIYANMTVYKRLKDGELAGWHIEANEGYVFYSTNDKDFVDEETGEIIPKPFLVEAFLPSKFDFDKFPYVAILATDI